MIANVCMFVCVCSLLHYTGKVSCNCCIYRRLLIMWHIYALGGHIMYDTLTQTSSEGCFTSSCSGRGCVEGPQMAARHSIVEIKDFSFQNSCDAKKKNCYIHKVTSVFVTQEFPHGPSVIVLGEKRALKLLIWNANPLFDFVAAVKYTMINHTPGVVFIVLTCRSHICLDSKRSFLLLA